MAERFTLLSELGRGGMGVVWKARDEEAGQIVALKLLRAGYADDPDYVIRFERELELARRIHSVHVVEVLGYGVRHGIPYLALEFVDGPSLRERLKEHGPYDWQEARTLLGQIATGLDDAHAAGVIHRDLKPSNVLMDSPRCRETRRLRHRSRTRHDASDRRVDASRNARLSATRGPTRRTLGSVQPGSDGLRAAGRRAAVRGRNVRGRADSPRADRAEPRDAAGGSTVGRGMAS